MRFCRGPYPEDELVFFSAERRVVDVGLQLVLPSQPARLCAPGGVHDVGHEPANARSPQVCHLEQALLTCQVISVQQCKQAGAAVWMLSQMSIRGGECLLPFYVGVVILSSIKEFDRLSQLLVLLQQRRQY